jgi:prepilin-type processing-associated H-X9-DG protein
MGSAHPRGINVVMGDGSVRQVPYGIDSQIFNALAHRNDGTAAQLDD